MKKVNNNINYRYRDILIAALVFSITFFSLKTTTNIFVSALIALILSSYNIIKFFIARHTISIVIDSDSIVFKQKSILLGYKSITFNFQDVNILLEWELAFRSTTKRGIIYIRGKQDGKILFILRLNDEGWNEDYVIKFLQETEIIKIS